MSDKIYGIKANKSLAEISPMNLNGDQTVTGEKTFEKISVKDLSIVNSASGAAVTFKAQDGRAFELTLPGRAGTIALLDDLPKLPKYYSHFIEIRVYNSDDSLSNTVSFTIINKSQSQMTKEQILTYLKTKTKDFPLVSNGYYTDGNTDSNSKWMYTGFKGKYEVRNGNDYLICHYSHSSTDLASNGKSGYATISIYKNNTEYNDSVSEIG